MKLNHPEIIFVIFALVFGFLMIFITPFNQVPDEYAHYLRAKEVSQGKLYNKPPEKMTKDELNTNTYNFHGASGYSPLMYTASGISLKLFPDIQLIGRFANLLVWILLIAIAINITPVFKWQLFFIALLPMSLYEGMSYSADSFSNAFAFLFFAYIFKLIFHEKEFSYKKDIPLLLLCGITGALSKGIILPLFLLPFVPIKKQKSIIILSILSAVFITSYLWSSNNYLATPSVTHTELNKYFIIHSPAAFLIILINTIVYFGNEWIIGVIGILGNLTIRLDRIIYYLTVTMFFCSIIFIPEKYKIKLSHRITAGAAFISYIFIICVLLYIMFTPFAYNKIVGIQGRYFISALPLLFVLFGQNINNKNDKYSEMFKSITIAYIFLLLCYTCFILYKVYLV
ncbi:MAG: hypothetical protein BHW55_04675 [Candidatus Melainabacteria bacterium 35_41]|nr:MAG: hypothetical protein BHW55_04675 [Candidatus Melainabacteria bacterium 35_41]